MGPGYFTNTLLLVAFSTKQRISEEELKPSKIYMLLTFFRNGFREGTVPKPRRAGAAAPSAAVATK